jgi:hypothetical protein
MLTVQRLSRSGRAEATRQRGDSDGRARGRQAFGRRFVDGRPGDLPVARRCGRRLPLRRGLRGPMLLRLPRSHAARVLWRCAGWPLATHRKSYLGHALGRIAAVTASRRAYRDALAAGNPLAHGLRRWCRPRWSISSTGSGSAAISGRDAIGVQRCDEPTPRTRRPGGSWLVRSGSLPARAPGSADGRGCGSSGLRPRAPPLRPLRRRATGRCACSPLRHPDVRPYLETVVPCVAASGSVSDSGMFRTRSLEARAMQVPVVATSHSQSPPAVARTEDGAEPPASRSVVPPTRAS